MFTPWEQVSAYEGLFSRYHIDEEGIGREVRQDAEPVLESAKHAAEVTGRDGRFMGSIPVVMYYQWIIEAEVRGRWAPGEDENLLNSFLLEKLKDSDYKRLAGR